MRACADCGDPAVSFVHTEDGWNADCFVCVLHKCPTCITLTEWMSHK